MFIFVYKTVNKINGKIYIGVHKTKSLEDGYIGCGVKSPKSLKTIIEYRKRSGRKVSPFLTAVEKYGYENFERKILKFFETYDEALKYESLIVNNKFVESKNTYNYTLGGRACIMTNEVKERLSKRMKENNPMYNKDISSHVALRKTGVKHSEETKLKIKNKLKEISKDPKVKERLKQNGFKSKPKKIVKPVQANEDTIDFVMDRINRNSLTLCQDCKRPSDRCNCY